jgi:hypothetical protein
MGLPLKVRRWSTPDTAHVGVAGGEPRKVVYTT